MNKAKTAINKELCIHISKVIKSKRVKAKLTQGQMAIKMGYEPSNQVIDNWERVRSSPSLGALYLMSILFDCPIHDFLPSTSEIASISGVKFMQVSTTVITLKDEDQSRLERDQVQGSAKDGESE